MKKSKRFFNNKKSVQRFLMIMKFLNGYQAVIYRGESMVYWDGDENCLD